MPVVRQQVGEPLLYKGYTIVARRASPCVLGYVDDEELPGFYANPSAVYLAGKRHVDEKIKANETRKS